MSKDSMSQKSRERLIKSYIARMPSLSTTTTKVIQVCNQPSTSPNDLFRVIGLDPVLTAQILKLINSAYYNLPNQVASLPRAIIMLGINTVKNLVLSTAVLKNLGGDDDSLALDMDEFWTHSICTGVTSKLIAATLGVPVDKREEFFVAGLLHDLGKIPLNNRFPEEYLEVMERSMEDECALSDVEQEMLEIDHCAVGGIIAEKWKLGEAIHNSILHHHCPDEAEKSTSRLTSVVALANIYANEIGLGSAGDNFGDKELALRLAREFGLKWNELLELKKTIEAEIKKAEVFLKLAK